MLEQQQGIPQPILMCTITTDGGYSRWLYLVVMPLDVSIHMPEDATVRLLKEVTEQAFTKPSLIPLVYLSKDDFPGGYGINGKKMHTPGPGFPS
jgi:hypothetical protein